MKILLLDIETAPNVAHVWGLYDQNVGVNQIQAAGYVMCWSAKWLDQKEVFFMSVEKDTPETMLRGIHVLLDECDVVVHYNGSNFDIPTLNKEFVTYGLKPPSPYKQIDLYQVVKRRFRFPSNKLEYVARTLKLGRKIKHEGHDLWTSCMANDPAAWKRMERYNKQDAKLLEKLYYRVLPWIQNHPNRGAYAGKPLCPNCGSDKLQRRGEAVKATGKYPRFQCTSCGKWCTGAKAEQRHSTLRAA